MAYADIIELLPDVAGPTSPSGTRPPDVHGALTGANQVDTCRVPSPFLDLQVPGVVSPFAGRVSEAKV
jgi:hypothetical protein